MVRMVEMCPFTHYSIFYHECELHLGDLKIRRCNKLTCHFCMSRVLRHTGGFKLQYDQKVNKELDQFWGERPIEMTTAGNKVKYYPWTNVRGCRCVADHRYLLTGI